MNTVRESGTRHFRNDGRREQLARLRARIKEIRPEDADMIALLGVVKGLMDIIDDAAGGRS